VAPFSVFQLEEVVRSLQVTVPEEGARPCVVYSLAAHRGKHKDGSVRDEDRGRKSDCWPDWSDGALAPEKIAGLKAKNSSGRVSFEIGIGFALACALVAVAPFLAQVL